MTVTPRATDSLSSRPRIRPAEAGDTRPVSVSARLGRLQFHHSGKFRVLQVADVQDGPSVAKDTVRLIASSLDTVRPDLVVFTGNQIAGYDPAFAETFVRRSWQAPEDDRDTDRAEALRRTRDRVRSAAAAMLAPLEERGVPFAVTYGNHDRQCGLDAAELDAIYREFPGCLNPAPADAPDDGGNVPAPVRPCSLLPDQDVHPCAPGTFALPVLDDGNTHAVIALAVIDSGGYARGGGFAAPSERTLGFLDRVPGLAGARTFVFQHMPIPEYYELLAPALPTADFAMQGYRAHSDRYYVLDEDAVQPGGYLGEGISCPDESTEGDILRTSGPDGPRFIGMAAGHDHRNGFVGRLDGLLLMATPTCGFASYGPAPARRATRLLEFDIRHPYEPRTQLLEFGELVGKPSSRKAYTYALNAAPPQDGEGDDLLRRPSLWGRFHDLLNGSSH